MQYVDLVPLITELTSKSFKPEQYSDHYRDRVREVVERKVAGEETTVTTPTAPRAQVIDLMEALKQSLARERTSATTKAAEEPASRRRVANAGRTAKKKQ